MGFYDETYGDISKRFKDWLTDQSTTGNFVSDIIKDKINRAQQRIWDRRSWKNLMTYLLLTLDSNKKVSNFPADYGREYAVYHDSNNDLKEDDFYFRNGRQNRGYRMTDIFNIATGHSFEMVFYQTPSNPATMIYQKVLADFSGSDDSQTSYFPGELLLTQAQLVHVEERALAGREYAQLRAKFEDIVTNYEQGNQYLNADFRKELLDDQGDRIILESYSLLGEGSTGSSDNFGNDYDG